MTARLLAVIAESRGLLAVLCVLCLPVAVVIDAVRRFLYDLEVERVMALRETRCPAGHRVALWLPEGGTTCPACGYTFGGTSIFAPCPACGEAADARCSCGRSVPGPLTGRRRT